MPDRELKPVWKTSSFLVYTGGLTVLLGGLAALGYLSTQYPGGGARTAWALLIFIVLVLVAQMLRRAGPWVAAGIFAFISVIAWGYLVGSAWSWFGWLNGGGSSAFAGWSLGRLTFEFLVLAAALVFRWYSRFPFIALISAVVGWLFVTDFISNGGWWTYTVTLVIGLIYLLAGSISDQPSAFWLHFVGGLLIGVPILHWFHTSDFDFAVVLVVSLFFVLIGYATRRSSWAVFGTIGFFIATIHYVVGSPTAARRRSLWPQRQRRRVQSEGAFGRAALHVDGELDQSLGAGTRPRPPRLLARLPRAARQAASRARRSGARLSLVTIEGDGEAAQDRRSRRAGELP